MIRLNQEQISFIKENFENWEELLNSADINDILEAVQRIMIYKGFDANYDLNDFGREAQRVYDSICYNN